MTTTTIQKVMRAAVPALLAMVLAVPAGAAKPSRFGAGASPAAAEASAASAATGGAVNLNTANETELDALPGVGPAKAQAVLAYRAKYGPFKKIEDLVRVKGFGRKTVAKLRPYLSLAGQTTYRGKGAAAAAEAAE